MLLAIRQQLVPEIRPGEVGTVALYQGGNAETAVLSPLRLIIALNYILFNYKLWGFAMRALLIIVSTLVLVTAPAATQDLVPTADDIQKFCQEIHPNSYSSQLSCTLIHFEKMEHYMDLAQQHISDSKFLPALVYCREKYRPTKGHEPNLDALNQCVHNEIRAYQIIVRPSEEADDQPIDPRFRIDRSAIEKFCDPVAADNLALELCVGKQYSGAFILSILYSNKLLDNYKEHISIIDACHDANMLDIHGTWQCVKPKVDALAPRE